MTDLITDATFRALETALDGLSLRQQVIGNNIANAETPGYQASAVTFEAQLMQAMERPEGAQLAATHAAHLAAPAAIAPASPGVTPRAGGVLRLDGNNVDIELEMSQLAETSIQFQALSQLIARKFSLLKTIAGGR